MFTSPSAAAGVAGLQSKQFVEGRPNDQMMGPVWRVVKKSKNSLLGFLVLGSAEPRTQNPELEPRTLNHEP